jgi:hypothetical protein
MTMVRPFVLSMLPAMLVLAACVGGPGDPSGNGQRIETRESSGQSDEPKPESAEPQASSGSETAVDAGSD